MPSPTTKTTRRTPSSPDHVSRNSAKPQSPKPVQSATFPSNTTTSYFTFPVTHTVSSLLRRLSGDSPSSSRRNSAKSRTPSLRSTDGSFADVNNGMAPTSHPSASSFGNGNLFAPHRTVSPYQPPPLTPLTLSGYWSSTTEGSKQLTRQLAEEIRLLVPPRLQLTDEWKLVYSLEQNGVSLHTLYKRCDELRSKRGGYVLVVKDGSGGTFGAYLSDVPQPQPHYYGTGECFLWRSSVLPKSPELDISTLPPPPSADTSHFNSRQTTLMGNGNGVKGSRDSSPERIRFKAFPYSGMNDYMIFCQAEFLSVGGGDGHYGLWLDDSLDKGISSSCPTFGNEPLSDEGSKFEVMGVEVWSVGG